MADAYFYERHFPVTETNELRIKGADPVWQDFRIVQLSDLHLEPFTTEGDIQRAVKMANSLMPDLIVITGDFITKDWKPAERLAEMLSDLKAPHGVYGCLGNHDFWNNPVFVKAALEKRGVRILWNESAMLTRNGHRLCLSGLASYWGGKPNLTNALRNRRLDDPVLLLMHEPDPIEEIAKTGLVSAQLSGHTHGGQVRAPGFSPFPVFLPKNGKKYTAGSHMIGETQLYVNRGIGCIGLPLRFAAAPEVTLHLVQADVATPIRPSV